jgi:acetyl-CoA carboxylase biotin carboxyl carrier protein
MIDIRKLKELVRLMVENDLSELDLQDQQETVTIKRGAAGQMIPMVAHAPMAHAPAPLAPAPAGASGAGDEDKGESSAEAGGAGGAGGSGSVAGTTPVNSPMVGTAYLAPNPDSPNFVKVGDTVGPETTICLIEAMKVFSEIKAECSGTVERVLVTTGQAVQYGQPLFLIRPG